MPGGSARSIKPGRYSQPGGNMESIKPTSPNWSPRRMGEANQHIHHPMRPKRNSPCRLCGNYAPSRRSSRIEIGRLCGPSSTSRAGGGRPPRINHGAPVVYITLTRSAHFGFPRHVLNATGSLSRPLGALELGESKAALALLKSDDAISLRESEIPRRHSAQQRITGGSGPVNLLVVVV